MVQNINILEQDGVDVDLTNITLTSVTNGISVSGSYDYAGTTYTINTTLTFPTAPNTSNLHEWNLYFWTTDHSWHLDVGQMQVDPTDPYACFIVAFGWTPGKSCTIPHDNSIWHIKPLPKDEKNPRPGHGVTSDGAHYHHPPSKGQPILVSPPTVTQ